MRRPPLHPACQIFPALGQDDLQELADDIAANGLRNPIVMYEGKLLDGRNRWEADWHLLMQDVVAESRRILKPQGSAVFILQPNARKFGEMRLWLWQFVAWAGKEWNLVEDAYWWNFMALPVRGARRDTGLLRPSVKMCVWLGPADCYRNQDAVLWTPAQSATAERRHETAMRGSPSGRTAKTSTLRRSRSGTG